MSTPEQLMKTKPPADVVAELKSFSTDSGKPMNDIKKIFYDTLVQPYLDQFTDIDERCRQASKVTLAILAQSYAYRSASINFKIFDMSSIRSFETEAEEIDPITNLKVKVKKPRHVCDIYGIFAGADLDEATYPTKFGILTLWDDACQVISSLQVNGTYHGDFGVTVYDNMYTFSLNDNTAPTPISLELPDARDIITNFFSPLEISQVKMANQLDGVLSAERGDYRLIKGRVRTGRTRLNNKGKLQGFIDIIDEGATIQSLRGVNAPVQSVMFLNSPEMAIRYTTGSMVYILCDITYDEQYGISCFGHMIIPIFGIPGEDEKKKLANSSSGTSVPSVPKPSVQQPSVPEQGSAQPPSDTVSNTESAPTPEDTASW